MSGDAVMPQLRSFGDGSLRWEDEMAGPVSRIIALGLASIAGTIVIAAAKADGLPVLGLDVGPTGVATPSGEARYVTLPARGATVVARVRRSGGQILNSATLPGNFTIPAVAYDGSAGGLSADGRELVLIQPRARFPRARTALAVLDAKKLRVKTILRFRGDFSFDAISPKGNLLYLIQYVSPKDPTRYRVRAYDLRQHRLLDAPVVDPREQSDKMRGNPLSRALSPDGRWAYTLYDGGGQMPFIHALDTSRRTARCIDLDALAGNRYLWRLRLQATEDGSALLIRDGAETELVVETKTFNVRSPAVTGGGQDGGTNWEVVGATSAAALVAAGALLLLARRRHQLAVER
jgi:hypothetical protein